MKRYFILIALFALGLSSPSLAQDNNTKEPFNLTIIARKAVTRPGDNNLTAARCSSVYLSKHLHLIAADCIPKEYVENKNRMYLRLKDNWLDREGYGVDFNFIKLNQQYMLLYVRIVPYADINVTAPLIRVNDPKTQKSKVPFNRGFLFSGNPFGQNDNAPQVRIPEAPQGITGVKGVYIKHPDTEENVVAGLDLGNFKVNITRSEAYVIAYVADYVHSEVKFVDDNLEPLDLLKEIEEIKAKKESKENPHKQRLVQVAKEIEGNLKPRYL